MFRGCSRALKLKSLWLCLFIVADKYIRILLIEQEERTLQRKAMDEERWKKEEKRKQELKIYVAGPDEYEGLDDRLNADADKDTEGEDAEECDKFDNDYEIEIPIYHKKQLAEAFGESLANEDKKPRLLEKMLTSRIRSRVEATSGRCFHSRSN